MKRLGSRSGLTLIEVTIAVTLLSFLSVGMLWALRIGLGAMGKADDHLLANRRVTGAQRILEQQIADLMPVPAEVASGSNLPGAHVPFFQGEEGSMRFVSSYSLRDGHRGAAQILEFAVIPGENNEGVRLIVNEWPYTGPRSAGQFVLGRVSDAGRGLILTQFAPIGAGPRSFVLADRLAGCRFSYLEARPRPETQRWTPLWVAESWPEAIRVEMLPLTPNDGRLHMTTVVAPVRATRLLTDRIDDN